MYDCVCKIMEKRVKVASPQTSHYNETLEERIYYDEKYVASEEFYEQLGKELEKARKIRSEKHYWEREPEVQFYNAPVECKDVSAVFTLANGEIFEYKRDGEEE